MPLDTDKHGGFKLSYKEELSSGLYPEVFSSKIPLWEIGSNVQFTDLGVQKVNGWDQWADTGNAEPIRGLLQSQENGAGYLYFGDLTQLYRVATDATAVTVLGTGYSLDADGSAAVWDSGTSEWDSGETLWDYGITPASHWSLVKYGTFVLATSGMDHPQVRKGVGSFVGMYQSVTGITIVSGGSGYVVGEVLTMTGGTFTTACTATVVTVSAGVITSIGMTTGGAGYTDTAAPPTGHTASASGTGATFTWTVSDMDVSSVEIFVNRGPHVLGFNTSTSGKEFIWCAADDTDTWVASTTNLAGQLEIRELETDIIAAVPMGNRVAVYGDDQMFLVNYLANDLVFGYQPAINGIGAVSKKSVVPVGRKNYGLSLQGFFVTDGVEFTYIDEPATRNWYQDNAHIGQLSKCIGFHDEEHNQIKWFFPTTTTTNAGGVVFNYRKNTWSIITGARSAGDERRMLNNPVVGSEGGIVYRESAGPNEAGAAITAYVRSKPISMGEAWRIKELDTLRMGYIGSGLQYRIGWAETETGSITWGSYTDISTGFEFQSTRTAGRWMFFEAYSAAPNAAWELMDVEFIGRIEGTR
jgi:hypothetical protein